MAQRRMFSLKIIDTDGFLDMPISTRELYFQFGMRADDDGFIGNPKRIMRMVGASDDDMKVLIAKQFIIPFDSGVCVIRDWRVHNYLQNDRHHATHFLKEFNELSITENGMYTKCIQIGNRMDTEIRIGEVSLVEDSKEKTVKESRKQKAFSHFIVPSIEEIKTYCEERNNTIEASTFFDFYESKGWMIGKNKMKDWRAAVRTWEKNNARGKDGTGKKSRGDRLSGKADFTGEVILGES